MGETLSQERIFLFDPAAQLFVKQKTRELRGAALFKEFNKDLASFRIELVSSTVELIIANKMMTVVVLAELLTDGLQFSLIGLEVHGSHGVEISCVEAGRQDCVLNGLLGCNCAISSLVGHGCRGDHQFRVSRCSQCRRRQPGPDVFVAVGISSHQAISDH